VGMLIVFLDISQKKEEEKPVKTGKKKKKKETWLIKLSKGFCQGFGGVKKILPE